MAYFAELEESLYLCRYGTFSNAKLLFHFPGIFGPQSPCCLLILGMMRCFPTLEDSSIAVFSCNAEWASHELGEKDMQ